MDDAAVAAAYASLTGAPIPLPARAHGAEWLAIARSIDEARNGWAALMIGTTGPQGVEVPLVAANAARARGLSAQLVATEAAPDRLARLQASLRADGLVPGAARLVAGTITADTARAVAGTPTAQDLLAEAPIWDLMRVCLRGLITPLLNHAEALLNARVRWLILNTHSRGEEALAVRVLDATGWRLMAERPALLDLSAPRRAQRNGTQVWRGPLA